MPAMNNHSFNGAIQRIVVNGQIQKNIINKVTNLVNVLPYQGPPCGNLEDHCNGKCYPLRMEFNLENNLI